MEEVRRIMAELESALDFYENRCGCDSNLVLFRNLRG